MAMILRGRPFASGDSYPGLLYPDPIGMYFAGSDGIVVLWSVPLLPLIWLKLPCARDHELTSSLSVKETAS